MEGHAAFPDAKDHQRVIEKIGEVVKQYGTDPAAEDDAERYPGDHVVDLLFGEFRPWPAGLHTAQPPATKDADDIHQSVPAHGERAQLQRDGIDRGIGDHGVEVYMACRLPPIRTASQRADSHADNARRQGADAGLRYSRLPGANNPHPP